MSIICIVRACLVYCFVKSWQFLFVLSAFLVELAFFQVFFRNRCEHVELQFLLVSFLDLSEATHHDEVHAVKELEALHEHAQGNEFSKPVHLVARHGIVHYRNASKHPSDEEEHKVAKLGNLIRPRVPQPDMLQHDSHVHGWI